MCGEVYNPILTTPWAEMGQQMSQKSSFSLHSLPLWKPHLFIFRQANRGDKQPHPNTNAPSSQILRSTPRGYHFSNKNGQFHGPMAMVHTWTWYSYGRSPNGFWIVSSAPLAWTGIQIFHPAPLCVQSRSVPIATFDFLLTSCDLPPVPHTWTNIHRSLTLYVYVGQDPARVGVVFPTTYAIKPYSCDGSICE